jgi:hypothetical protein
MGWLRYLTGSFNTGLLMMAAVLFVTTIAAMTAAGPSATRSPLLSACSPFPDCETTLSIPARCRSRPGGKPDGPVPTIATCVRSLCAPKRSIGPADIWHLNFGFLSKSETS